jgi:RNA polymerase sigma factor (sigma-70 family)
MPTPEIVSVLVDNHRQFLAFLERRVGSRATAEDILQDAFVRGIGHAGELRDGESAVAWFYRLLRNALVDHYRRKGTEARAIEALAREAPEGEPAVDDELFRTVCSCVTGLLDGLKPEYASALRRVDVDGLPVAAFAKEAGITPNNASVRLHRARLGLKKDLEAACGTCATHGCFDCSCESAPRV